MIIKKLNIFLNFVIIFKVEGDCMLKYEKGKIVTGQVTGIEKYGIFVNLDQSYSGLIHISEISDDFVKNINDYVSIGETIKVKVVEIDEESLHVKLSIKNVNYRNVKRNNNKLQEVSRGFLPLEEKMPTWISEKLEEIESDNNK